MAWTTKVLHVFSEYRNKEGELKSKWEVTRLESDDGKHFSPGLQKTGYYKKDGEEKRGYPQALSKYDIKWILDNRDLIQAKLEPVKEAEKAVPSPAAKPAAAAPLAGGEDDLEEVPF